MPTQTQKLLGLGLNAYPKMAALTLMVSIHYQPLFRFFLTAKKVKGLCFFFFKSQLYLC